MTGTKRVWAVEWRSMDRIYGDEAHLMWENGRPLTFDTRESARRHIAEKWGYIRERPYAYLRREPHGWRMPRPVRAVITFAKEAKQP